LILREVFNVSCINRALVVICTSATFVDEIRQEQEQGGLRRSEPAGRASITALNIFFSIWTILEQFEEFSISKLRARVRGRYSTPWQKV
jgi:hypothetical protein